MNTTPSHFSRPRAHWPCAFLLLGSVLSGCGGGGGTPATTTVAQVAHITLSGTLLDSAGAPLVGYKVVYAPAAATAHARRAEDTSGSISAVTDSQGRYTLSIPVSEATPGATLSAYDTAGVLVQSQTITLDPSQPVQTTVTTVAPPSTPTSGTDGAVTPPPPPVPPI